MPDVPDPIAEFFGIDPAPKPIVTTKPRQLFDEVIVLPGMIRMKKNTSVKYGIRSKAYQVWQHGAEAALGHYGHVIPIDEPVNLQVRFFINTKTRFDISNALEGVQDILVKAGVLSDDNYNIVASLNGTGVTYDKDTPAKTEITITRKARTPEPRA